MGRDVTRSGTAPALDGTGAESPAAHPAVSAADIYARAIRAMNQGFALSVPGEAHTLFAAITCYALAAELLRSLPLVENPAWANGLGAALMNHGQLLHRVHGLARADEALRSFDEAIGVLRQVSLAALPWAARNLAGTHINRANLQLDRGGAAAIASARADALAALALVRGREREEPVAADLALKARRVHCDALGLLLGQTSELRQQDALASTAGDVVDDALALIRYWHGRSEAAFDELAVRFFRFGAELYRHHQPHFLSEFIEEYLDLVSTGGDEMRLIAHRALHAALADGAKPGLHLLETKNSERALRARGEIAATLAQLERERPLDPA